MGLKLRPLRFDGLAWLLAPMLLMALAACGGNHGESTVGASGGNGSRSTSTAPVTSSSETGGSDGGSSDAVGGSSAIESPSTSGAGGIAGQTSDPRATPYTLFVHDDAYGNVHLGAIAVDETHVYFAENGGRLLRRRIDGSDRAVLFGEWSGTLLGAELALDREYVYWLDDGALVRASKVDGTPESIALGGGGGDVIATESYVYAATDGCLSIMRVAHGTLEKQVLTAPTSITSPGGGFTFLWLDGTDLYCANGPRIFVSNNWGELRLLISNAGQPVVGIAVVDGVLYWFSERRPMKFYRYSKDGTITLMGSANYELISRRLVADPPRKRILFTQGAVISFSTETGLAKTVVDSDAARGIDHDSDYLYWGRATFTTSSIERMPLTQE